MKLRIREYTVKASGNRATGVIAQEVQSVMPELVVDGEDGYLKVKTVNSWKLVKAIQELKEENEMQKRKIDILMKIVCQGHPDTEICRNEEKDV
mgnify:CR=1 FL=1